MPELVNKGALSEEIESLTVHITGLRAGKGVLSKFMEEYRKSVLRTIDEQPTTTEAEIWAKALKYAQSRFRNTYETMVANKMENCINWADMLDSMVAEQLKEE